MDKAFVLKNLDEAIRLVTEQPEELLDLGAFAKKTDCGTIMCIAGLLTTSAHFRKLGWKLALDQNCRPQAEVSDEILMISPDAEKQFGPNHYWNLFCSRHLTEYDERRGTDKEVALARLRRQRDLVESLP